MVLYSKLGFSFAFFKFLFFFYLLVVVSFIDIDYHAIPAYLCPLGIVGGLTFMAFGSKTQDIFFDLSKLITFLSAEEFNWPDSALFNSFIGLLFGLGFAYLFKLFGDMFIAVLLYIRKKESIEGERESLGLGDVDFLGVVGVFLGWRAVILTFFIAPFFAIAYSLFALIFKKSHLIPYLPYLSLAAVVVFFWGNKILSFVF